MEDGVFKFDRFLETERHKDRILQAHAIGAAQIVAGIVRGGDPSQHGVGRKYLTLASEVEDLRIGTCLDLAGKGISVGDLLYEWSRINQAAESVEIIKQGARV